MHEATAELLATACRVLAGEGLSRVSTGHVSARIGTGGNVAMRGRPATDAGLEFAEAGDMVEMTMDGHVVAGEARPPRECFIHLEILRARPDVNSVVHMHPRWVVALRAAGVELAPIYGAYDPEGLRLALGDIAYFHSSRLIDSPESGRELAAVLGSRPCCVLDGHGIVTVGASVESAVLTAIALDELAHVTWLAASVGTPVPISAEDQAHMSGVVEALRAQVNPTHGGTNPATSAWQHWAERDRRRRDKS